MALAPAAFAKCILNCDHMYKCPLVQRMAADSLRRAGADEEFVQQNHGWIAHGEPDPYPACGYANDGEFSVPEGMERSFWEMSGGVAGSCEDFLHAQYGALARGLF